MCGKRAQSPHPDPLWMATSHHQVQYVTASFNCSSLKTGRLIFMWGSLLDWPLLFVWLDQLKWLFLENTESWSLSKPMSGDREGDGDPILNTCHSLLAQCHQCNIPCMIWEPCLLLGLGLPRPVAPGSCSQYQTLWPPTPQVVDQLGWSTAGIDGVHMAGHVPGLHAVLNSNLCHCLGTLSHGENSHLCYFVSSYQSNISRQLECGVPCLLIRDPFTSRLPAKEQDHLAWCQGNCFGEVLSLTVHICDDGPHPCILGWWVNSSALSKSRLDVQTMPCLTVAWWHWVRRDWTDEWVVTAPSMVILKAKVKCSGDTGEHTDPVAFTSNSPSYWNIWLGQTSSCIFSPAPFFFILFMSSHLTVGVDGRCCLNLLELPELSSLGTKFC